MERYFRALEAYMQDDVNRMFTGGSTHPGRPGGEAKERGPTSETGYDRDFGGDDDDGPSVLEIIQEQQREQKEDFIQSQYDALNMDPDPEGKAYWENRIDTLNQQGMSFDDALKTVEAEIDGAVNETVSNVIEIVYDDRLGRTPDQAGQSYFEDRVAAEIAAGKSLQDALDTVEAEMNSAADEAIDQGTEVDKQTRELAGSDPSQLSDEQLETAISVFSNLQTAVSADVLSDLQAEQALRLQTPSVDDTIEDQAADVTLGTDVETVVSDDTTVDEITEDEQAEIDAAIDSQTTTTTPTPDIEVEVPEPEPEPEPETQFTFQDAVDYAVSQGQDLAEALDTAEAMIGTRPYSFAPEEAVSIQGTTGLGLDINQLPGANQVQFDATGKMVSAPKEFQDAFEELTNKNPLTGDSVITIGGSLQRGDALSQEIESLLQEGYELGSEDDELVSPEGVTVSIEDLMGMLEALEGGSEGGGGQEGETGGGGAKGGLGFDPGGTEGAATGQDLVDIDLPEVDVGLGKGPFVQDTDAAIDTGAVGVGQAETDATGEGRTEGESEETTGKGQPGGAIGGDKTGGVSILPGEEGPILPGGEGAGVVGEGGDDIIGMGDEGTGDGVGGGEGTGDGAGTGAGTGTGTGTGTDTGDGTGEGGEGGTGGDGVGGDDDDDFDLEPVDPLEIDGYDFGETTYDPMLDFEYRQPQITSPFDFARDFGSYTLSPEIEQSFQDLTAERLAQGFEPAALYEPEFLEQIGIMSPERQAEEGIASLIGSRFPQFTPAGERYPFTSTPEESAQALVDSLLAGD